MNRKFSLASIILVVVILLSCSFLAPEVSSLTVPPPADSGNQSVEATAADTATATPAVVGPENLDKVTVLHAYDRAIRLAGFNEISISTVAYSPDGRYVAIAGCSGLARSGARGSTYCGSEAVGEGSPYLIILDAGTAEQIANVPENEPYTTVTDLAFTHEGDKLVYAMNPGKVAMWNIEQRKIEDVLWKPVHGYWHPGIAVSPDDHWIAIMGIHNSFEGEGDELRIWDEKSGKSVLEASINGSRQWGSVAGGIPVTGWHPYFSAESQRVLIPSYPDFIVYDTATWKEMTRFPSRCDPPCMLAVSPDLSFLAVLEGAGAYEQPRSFTIWDISKGEQIASLADHVESSGPIAFTPDGRMLLQDQWNVGTAAWSTASWQFIGMIPGIYQSLAEMEFAGDGSSFMAWGEGGVGLYGFEAPAPDLTQQSTEVPSTGALEIPSGKLLLEDYEYNTTRGSLDLTGLEVLSLPDQKIEPYPLALMEGDLWLFPSPDYRRWVLIQWLKTGSTDQVTYFLVGPEFSAPVPILESDGNDGDPSWSWDGRQLAFGSSVNEGIRVYDVQSGRLKKLPIKEFNPNCPAFSPSGDRIVFAAQSAKTSVDGLYLINLDGSNEVMLGEGVFNFGGCTVFWKPDGSSIFALRMVDCLTGHCNELYRFDVLTGKVSLLSGDNDVIWFVLSPDGKFLAYETSYPHDDVHVIGAEPGNTILERVLEDSGSPVWSPDSRYIAYFSGSGTDPYFYINVLDVSTGQETEAYATKDLKYPLGWLP